MWPTEPARAGWSFNKWQRTRIPKGRRLPSPGNRHRSSSRQPSVPAWAEARAAVVERVVAADEAVADEAGPVPAAVAVRPVDRAERAATVRADRVVVDADAMASRVTVTVDAAMVETISSKT